jgi:N-acetylglutamate synthase-like GNAT family acetyltransferase
MDIREAVPEESKVLQRLQARAPQGKSLVVSTVNIPDFFSRARAYQSYKVFNAYEENVIIGSAACAIRDAVVGARVLRVGYELQYFTSPDCQRQGVARSLRHTVESYLTDQGVALSYALIMEGNAPSMHLFEREGFHLHRKLVMPAIGVVKEVQVPGGENIRSSTPRDLEAVAQLLNQTWHGHDLFEPASAASLAHQFERIPTLDYSDLLLLEDEGRILACLALWDWSKIMRITVLRLNPRMRLLGKLLVLARIVPRFPGPGDTLRQMMLTMIGYESSAHLVPLVKHVNNLALKEGIEQVFCVCERDDKILESMKGFTRVDTGVNLYVKPLRPGISMADAAVAMTGFDM